MIPITIGIALFIGLILFVYFISSYKDTVKQTQNTTKKNTPKKEDIVLAEITNYKNPIPEYGILWNAEKGTYDYSISSEGKEIAKGTTSSENTMFKIKGIPLVKEKNYTVRVADTIVDIQFQPPSYLLNTLTTGDSLECNTDVVPTNLEIVSGASLIPKFNCHFKLEPPGLICDVKGYKDLVLMIYNGPNTVNILTDF